ncbi:MAG TPA: helix-turn-helix transcriptional regulator [Bacilli bacterium]|nr:helix-turn-helix transcriptional regulator [Bacilli bacterium]
MNAFSWKLIELRKKKGLKQKDLTTLFDVTQQAVSKWETGQSYPDIPTLKKMASFFDVSLDELIKDEEYESFA